MKKSNVGKHSFKKRKFWILIFFFFGCTTLSEVKIKNVEIRTPLLIKKKVATKKFQFVKLIMGLKKGDFIGIKRNYVIGFCSGEEEMAWMGNSEITNDKYLEIFYNSFKIAGYPVLGNPKEIFPGPNREAPDYLVGAKIVDYKLDICTDPFGIFYENAYIKINWQFFSNKNQEIVYEVSTEGSYHSAKNLILKKTSEIEKAFQANVKNLMAEPGFHELITSDKNSAPTHNL